MESSKKTQRQQSGHPNSVKQTPVSPVVTDAPSRTPDPGSYLHAIPSVVPSIVAILTALVLFAMSIGTVQNAVSRQATLVSALAGSGPAAGTPVLTVNPDSWAINGQPVSEADLLFKLSAAAGRSSAIVIESAPALPAARLTRALEIVNEAGFTQVGMPGQATPSETVSSH